MVLLLIVVRDTCSPCSKSTFRLNYRAAGTGKRCIDDPEAGNCPRTMARLSVDFMTDCHEGEDTGTDECCAVQSALKYHGQVSWYSGK